MNTKTAVISYSAAFFAGIIVMASSTPTDANQSQEVQTVIKYKTEVVTETIETNVFPESCLDAQRFSKMIRDDVSAVAATMGEQLQIASEARLAINGSNYLNLNDIVLDQRDLENSMRAGYTNLANVQRSLDLAIADCDAAIASGLDS